MAFESYKGGLEIGAGFTPSGDGGFPLMQACDIQIDEEGTTLEDYVKQNKSVPAFTYSNGTLHITSNTSLPKE